MIKLFKNIRYNLMEQNTKTMIKFFRHIRYNLMETGKTGKYLKYAIGEIILVVIGILIALSINNWNENRKLQSEELKLLFDIKSNLETTLVNLKNDVNQTKNDILLYSKIESYIKQDLAYSTELDSSFAHLTFWSSPFITSTAYNTLQSKGLDLIKSEHLKNNIVNLYEVIFARLMEDYNKSEWNLSQTVITKFFSKHIRRLHNQDLFLARPNDFESLKTNDEFKNILSMLLRQRKRGLNFFDDSTVALEALIKEIETELQTRQ